MIAAFIAGFISFPIVLVALVAPYAYRAIQRVTGW